MFYYNNFLEEKKLEKWNIIHNPIDSQFPRSQA